MGELTLKGHVLSRQYATWEQVISFLSQRPLVQVQIAVADDGLGWVVSWPIPTDQRSGYAFLYKRNEKAVKQDEEPDPFDPGPRYA